MTDLSSYLNVFNTCLVLLDRRGYQLAYDKESDAWFAEKNGFRFRADNPIELLGLAAIYEEIRPREHAEYWWRIQEPDLLSGLDPERS